MASSDLLLRNVSTSWLAPPFSALVVDANCTAATDWLAARTGQLAGGDPARDGTLRTGMAFVNSTVPASWAPRPAPADLAAWYLDVWAGVDYGVDAELDDVRVRAAEFAYFGCGSMVCAKLDWQGDDNVSGIGMMISYYLAASLATIYFLVLVPSRLGYYRSLPARFPRLARCVDAFRESVNTFLDTALIFAVAMLGAAVVRYARVLRQREEDYSTYALYGTTAMSAFSIFPAVMLQAVADGLRGRFLRQFLWALVIGLTAAVEGLYAHTLPDRPEYGDDDGAFAPFSSITQFGQIVWLSLCEGAGERGRVRAALTAAHVVLGANTVWWLYYVVSSLAGARAKARVYRARAWKAWSRGRPWLRVASGTLCLAAMWLLLVVFGQYRAMVMGLSGRSNEDDRWTFGQVLSLATWCPVLVDYAAVLLYGPERGLSERLSRRYEAVATKDSEEDKTVSSDSLRYGRIDQLHHHDDRAATV
ncbi:hypothetical protein F4775DRAFT_597323 [Biscogniauxia sp. FL1348]|nr:hypothetical protein F4775DRAFT_597323 [Biscogniauxia sp. FL1348]